MESSPVSVPSAKSSSKSSNSSRVPGTPKPPFEPPRRRSSLFFTKVLQHASSPRTPGSTLTRAIGKDNPEMPGPNIGRKRMASPRTRSAAMPGHVAQMQRLFQTAKASLRFDVRFAASATGSIDSRLPSSPETGHYAIGSPSQSDEALMETPKTDWRYSTAPKLVAELDLDVREPFPEGSPQLPQLPRVDLHQGRPVAMEPPSSGFTSPVANPVQNENVVPSPHADTDRSDDENRCIPHEEYLSPDDLERPMTHLQVSSDNEMNVDGTEESPIICHLKRKSADVQVTVECSSDSTGSILLPPSAKAAADSARLRRGMLSSRFPKPQTTEGDDDDDDDDDASSSNSSKSAVTPCPDPLLHERTPMVLCPDPGMHFSSSPESPSHRSHPRNKDRQYHRSHHQHHLVSNPPKSFNRTTATGSPMPALRMKPAHKAPAGLRRPPYDNRHPNSTLLQPPRHPLRPHLPPRDYLSGATEHFQPGWYYARDSPDLLTKPGTAMYSFSTAAGKVSGHDAAPDSMIRDSYRTDTLTPLARPPSRFRKHGVAAIATARGVSKYYGRSYGPRPSLHQKRSNGTRLPDEVRFRSSPPRSTTDSDQAYPTQPRQRSRELEGPSIEVPASISTEAVSMDPRLKLEDGEDIIEIDEETRAAVRMSLYGGTTIDPHGSDASRGLKDLSPNVMQWRKGHRPPKSRRKRRPSYWDTDLKEVMRSPAARHVVSSPIKEADMRSQKGEVGCQNDDVGEENETGLGILEGIPMPARKNIDLQGDIAMEG
ncbi:hypothetical protein PV08_08426 [Exophiala spinifera]|uniref:Uncharacterized protein n=1 Tax=Exophiala spinifera TaxID=91928 RepID=A0A0D2BQ30_9EURO|nr:uncharacterized protein PV08_08426 [Exophiala spinifera]KIW13239.1 hypothetical protein PV08_08426 [Exophiala spinifera]